jgi:hypothetical protein
MLIKMPLTEEEIREIQERFKREKEFKVDIKKEYPEQVSAIKHKVRKIRQEIRNIIFEGKNAGKDDNAIYQDIHDLEISYRELGDSLPLFDGNNFSLQYNCGIRPLAYRPDIKKAIDEPSELPYAEI